MIDYEKNNKTLARNLRKLMTPWERKLWYTFLREYPVRFQRQKTIGPFIVDFFCAKATLILELDGSGHYESEQMEKDAERTEYLQSQGFTVIRIPNSTIDKNFAGVCEMIDFRVKEAMEYNAKNSRHFDFRHTK